MPRNIEIKARIDSVDAVLTAAREAVGGAPQLIHQDDTFFRVAHGRLKLRELADGIAELIHYHRPDSTAAKASDYVRIAVPDAAALRLALERACGVLGRVRKTRWLLLDTTDGFNTRIHLDRVEGLGEFMELEVVLQEGHGDAQGTAAAEALMVRLGLAGAARLAGSYLDLQAAAAGESPAP